MYDGERVAEGQDYDGDTQKVYTHAGPSIHQPVLAQRMGGASEWFLGDMLGSTLGYLDANEALGEIGDCGAVEKAVRRQDCPAYCRLTGSMLGLSIVVVPFSTAPLSPVSWRRRSPACSTCWRG